MTSPDRTISVIAPLSPALDRVKLMLFQPFDLEKWMVIGFSAWLATLGQGNSGAGGGINYRTGHRQEQFRHMFETTKDWVMGNLHWLIPLAALLVFLGIVLWLTLLWLSSRGRFIFLHCVAGNSAEVRVPWQTYATHGNSLFLFRVGLGFLAFVLGGIALGGGGWLVTSMIAARSAGLLEIASAACLAVLALLVGLAFVVIARLTTDFVVPLMFLQTRSCLTGWQELKSLLAAYPAQFLLYLLFLVALKLGIGLAILAVVLLTCCVAGCLLALPYIGTVLLLPVLVFERSFSLYFLAQFDPKYDVFLAATQGKGADPDPALGEP